ncbi:MAG: hypothetical protein JWR03_1927 [Cohnella sp.]|nr:hypothetical protein [Cohnella sp.]
MSRVSRIVWKSCAQPVTRNGFNPLKANDQVEAMVAHLIKYDVPEEKEEE